MGKEKAIRRYARETGKKDQLDRLREYMFLEKKKLSKTDEDCLRRLEQVNQLLTTGYSVSNCVKKIQTDFDIGLNQAYGYVRKAQALFGDIRESSKNGRRVVLEEMYMKGALKAIQNNDMAAYLHALDSIARMFGLFDSSAININLAQLQMPSVVVTDTSLEALKSEMESTVHIE